MKKIGIMGGSFDPIHNGHLIIAERSRNEFGLDKIIFIPTGNPPHKKNINMSSTTDRYNMTELAIKDNEYFTVSDIESNNKEISYTINTLRYFKEIYPESTIYFILGGDSLIDFIKWKNHEDILKSFKIIVAKREVKSEEEFLKVFNYLNTNFPETVYLLESPLIEISSTYIRNISKNNSSIKYLVPSEVENYILKNKLYTRW